MPGPRLPHQRHEARVRLSSAPATRPDNVLERLQLVENGQDRHGFSLARIIADILELKASLVEVRARTDKLIHIESSEPSCLSKSHMDKVLIDPFHNCDQTTSCLQKLEARVEEAERTHKQLSMRMESSQQKQQGISEFSADAARKFSAEVATSHEFMNDLKSQVNVILFDFDGFQTRCSKTFDGLEARIAQAELSHDQFLMKLEKVEPLSQLVREVVKSHVDSLVEQIGVDLDEIKSRSKVACAQQPLSSPSQPLAHDSKSQVQHLVFESGGSKERSIKVRLDTLENRIEQAERCHADLVVCFLRKFPSSTLPLVL